MALPQAIAHNRNRSGGGQIFLHRKIASHDRRHAEHRKKADRYACGVQPPGISFAHEVESPLAHGDHRIKHGVALLPLRKDGWEDRTVGKASLSSL